MFLSFRTKFERCDFRTSNECFNIIADPLNKAFTISTSARVSSINSRDFKRGISSLHIIEDFAAYSRASGIAIRAFSPLRESFNGVLDRMVSSGLAQKFISDFRNPRDKHEKEDPIGPQVLTIDDLGVAFLICCIPLAISLIVFFVELSIFWSLHLWNVVKARITVPLIIIAFFEHYGRIWVWCVVPCIASIYLL